MNNFILDDMDDLVQEFRDRRKQTIPLFDRQVSIEEPMSIANIQNHFSSNNNQVISVISDMLALTKGISLDSQEEYNQITAIYAQARDWKKVVEQERKEMVEPLRKEMAKINDRAKEISEPLDEVIAISNEKVAQFQQKLAQIKIKDDQKALEVANFFDIQDSVYIAPLAKVMRGEGAMAVTVTEKNFKVLDISKVPAKYLLVDEKAIKRDLKLGITSIDGIEVFEETKTTLRKR